MWLYYTKGLRGADIHKAENLPFSSVSNKAGDTLAKRKLTAEQFKLSLDDLRKLFPPPPDVVFAGPKFTLESEP